MDAEHFIVCGVTYDEMELEHEVIFKNKDHAERIVKGISAGDGIIDARDWIVISTRPLRHVPLRYQSYRPPRSFPSYHGIPACHVNPDLLVGLPSYTPLDLEQYFPRMRHLSWEYMRAQGLPSRYPGYIDLTWLREIIRVEKAERR